MGKIDTMKGEMDTCSKRVIGNWSGILDFNTAYSFPLSRTYLKNIFSNDVSFNQNLITNATSDTP